MIYLKTTLIAILLLSMSFGGSLAEEDKNTNRDTVPEPNQPGEISWMRYDEGLTKAESEGKHVFIDFSVKSCFFCRKMEKTTYADEGVINLLNGNFIPVRVHGDSNHQLDIDGYKVSEKNLSRFEFGVTGFPTFWFLESDGTKLGTLRGYQRPDQFKEILTYVAERKYDTTSGQPPPRKGK